LVSPGEIERFFAALDEELTKRTGSNQLDILVNNAGIASPASYREMSVEQFDHLFAVNVRGAFLMTQPAIRRMRRGGRIINISSLASRHAAPSPMVPPYSMTKAALGWLRSRRAKTTRDTQGHRSKTALGRIGEVRDIANLARFLASTESQWITRQYIEASGGFRL
jgi:3-oxoacyl-[acyl-carrier protein] reductase